MSILSSSRYRVDGNSMSPTLIHGQYVLAGTLSLPWNQLQRGLIVVLRHPVQNHRIYIKRVVGLPQESLTLKAGVTYVNDVILEEPYLDLLRYPLRDEGREWWMGPDEYFVMGDNRSDSEDSRIFGPVGKELILGRVWFRYWPLKDWGRVTAGQDQDGRG
jgi:signal peptidase I